MSVVHHAPDVAELLEELHLVSEVDYRGYAPLYVAAHVLDRVRAEGLADIGALRDRIKTDRASLERLVLAMAPRPRPFFADVDWLATLRRDVVPRLRTYPSVRVWHAGCGPNAQDAYATAIVLREEGLLERSQIYATDVSDIIVDRARQGVVGTWAQASADAYRQGGGLASLEEYVLVDSQKQARVRPLLSDHIVFAVHSFASDASFNEFHLIICRDVLGHCDAALQRNAFHTVRESLCRFGFLVVDAGDMPPGGQTRSAFAVVRPEVELYRRVV